MLFQHPERGLIGVARPPKKDGDSITVPMQSGATLTGRLVDSDGRPQAGAELWLELRTVSNEKPHWSSYSPDPVWTDREGRFRIEALSPGCEFRPSDIIEGRTANGLFIDALRPGQAKDLGDVRMTAEED